MAAGITLASTAPVELAIDTLCFIAFCGDDVQAAEFNDTWAERDISAAAGHVGGNGDAAFFSSPGNNFRLLLVLPCVEYLVGEAALIEQCAEMFRGGNRSGADKHRTLLKMNLADMVHDRRPFFSVIGIYSLAVIFPPAGFVCGHF